MLAVAWAAAYADSDPRSRSGSFWHQTDARSGDENPLRAVDRQSTPLVPVCTRASDSRTFILFFKPSHRAANIRHFHRHRLLGAECYFVLSGDFHVERYV